MNENIGVKGTGKDHIRSMTISKKRKEKIKREYRERKLREKEKKLKRQQIENIIRVVPIAVVGETLRVITSKPPSKEEQQTEIKSSIPKAKKIIIDDKVRLIIKSKVEVKQVSQNKIEIKKDILTKQDEEKRLDDNKQKIEKTNENEKKEPPKEVLKEQKYSKKDNEQEEKNKKNNILPTIIPIALAPLGVINLKNYGKSYKKQEISKKKETIEKTISDTTNEDKLKKIETLKIVEAYEKRFKDIRYELKSLIYEYNVIQQQLSKTYKEEDIDKLLERLNIIIYKLEELKSKIKVDDIYKYDDNYLYSLVEEYIKNFDDNQIISKIKDSDLYVLLSSKISELDSEKDKLSTKLINKKDKLHISEEKLTKLKSQYFNIEKFNESLAEFQKHQEETIVKIQEKIKNSDKIYEQVETKVVGMTEESQKLLDLLTLQMMTPGLNSARAMATTTMLYLFFMRKAIKPKIEIEKHKVIRVTDYSKEIENNINSIDNISDMLSKTSHKLDEMIEKFKIEYKDFLGEVPECNQLLANLQRVKLNLQEKEYEIKKIEEAQKQNLEKNYDKIKTLNNKRVV